VRGYGSSKGYVITLSPHVQDTSYIVVLYKKQLKNFVFKNFVYFQQ